ncbi:MAG: glycoside hydrolase family 2 TIM barrel-domain containing protein [Trueperella sp.]|nr:glycoside hydrolase family 2 TIM barrel-domain containing protein [Trueperella sp.]
MSGPSTSEDLIHLPTKFGADLDPEAVWTENPNPSWSRPAGARSMLNGKWQYRILPGTLADMPRLAAAPLNADGDILVPFSPESLLSGVQRRTMPTDLLIYERTIPSSALPANFTAAENQRLLLHFGAVDQSCQVYLDGQLVATHQGGYFPFAVDITDYLTDQPLRLTVGVTDPSQTGARAYGKQTLERGKIWYSATSGIWQSVWLEQIFTPYLPQPVIQTDLHSVTFRFPAAQTCPDSFPINWKQDELSRYGNYSRHSHGKKQLPVKIEISAQPVRLDQATDSDAELAHHYETSFRGKPTVETELIAGENITLDIPHPQLWSPDTPHLYLYRIDFGTERVCGYFGLRTCTVAPDATGTPRLLLNGKPTLHLGVLDQGYWSDGILTPATDAAFVADIQDCKDLGFNMIRKHIKIEPQRWYFHCDRIGMLVWQDFVSGGGPYNFRVISALPFAGFHLRDDADSYRKFGRKSAESRQYYWEEARRTLRLLQSQTSIVVWVPFNEGWGQFDAAKVYQWLHVADPTRPIDHASGWHDQEVGDFQSRHIYFRAPRLKADGTNRAYALSEFGGFNYAIPGHVANTANYGYRSYKTLAEYQQGVLKLMRRLLKELPILAATVYTQLSDVEDEVNGLVSYDRAAHKWPQGSSARAELVKIHRQLRKYNEN